MYVPCAVIDSGSGCVVGWVGVAGGGGGGKEILLLVSLFFFLKKFGAVPVPGAQ